MIRLLAAVLTSLAALAAEAQPAETLRLYGYAYDLESNAYIYTEVHAQRIENGKWTGGTIAYYAPDGTRIGIKALDFTRDEFVPEYQMQLADGYSEAILDSGDPLKMERRAGRDRPVEHESIKRPVVLCADSGFHNFMRAHFKELIEGQTLKFHLAVAGSLDTFRFRVKRVEDTTFEEQPAVRFLVEPDSLLRFVADPLQLTYEPTQRKLLEFRGISNVHDPRTGRQFTARIAYYSKPPPDAPPNLPPLQ